MRYLVSTGRMGLGKKWSMIIDIYNDLNPIHALGMDQRK